MSCKADASYKVMMMKSRTSILIAIAIVGSLLAEPGHAARKKRVVLIPKQAGQGIAIVVGEKTRVYHPLSLEKPSVVEVKGPGDLRILTRARFDARTTGDLAYRLLYTIDGAEQHAVDIEGVERAPDARYKDIPSATPGDAEELTLSIGRGQHGAECCGAISFHSPQTKENQMGSPVSPASSRAG
jgi:hypothetical protein